MRCIPLSAVMLGLVIGWSSPGVAEEPIALHPENGHYFIWHGEPTILVTSGEHYGALLNLDFDFRTYFDTLAADGLNHTRVFSGTYREVPASFGITQNTLAPAPRRYIAPWKRSDQPGYADGGNKFDLTEFDPAYFERLRELMTAAKERGIVVEFNLFCPLYTELEWNASPFHPSNNTGGFVDLSREEVLSLSHPELLAIQEAFVRKVVRELNEFDNVYFEICNEPYQRSVSDDWQARMIEVIRETEQELPHRHLISLNVANGAEKIEKPPEGVSIFNFHYCVPPDAVTLNFDLNRVIGENETGFRGRHDFLYRSEAWDFLLAGGGLFNNLDYSFSVEHPAGDLEGYQSPGGGSAALRRQLGVLKRFLDEFDFVSMRPDTDVVRAISEDLVWRGLSKPGEAYAIYVHVPVPPRPDQIEAVLRTGIAARLSIQLPKGSYRAEWVSPLTGEVMKAEEWDQTAAEHEISTPTFDNDVALRIRREGNR